MSDSHVQPQLPSVDHFIAPFELREDEQDSLSSERQEERERTNRLRAELQKLFDELGDLRALAEREATEKKELVDRWNDMVKETDRIRKQETGFMEGLLRMAGQLAAVSQSPGRMTVRALDAVHVKATFGDATFEAGSDRPGVKVVSLSFTREMTLTPEGLSDFELLGLAQAMGWSGGLSERLTDLLPSLSEPQITVKEPEPDSDIPDPLFSFLQTVSELGLKVEISKEGHKHEGARPAQTED